MHDTQEELPKGMQKLPDEYQETEDRIPITHQHVNYTKAIRDALEGMKDVDVQIRKIEVVEQNNTDTMVSILMHVRGAK